MAATRQQRRVLARAGGSLVGYPSFGIFARSNEDGTLLHNWVDDWRLELAGKRGRRQGQVRTGAVAWIDP